MDWRECIHKKIVKEVGKDENLIASLIRTAENKIEIQNTINMNEKSASVKVTLMYDAVRELLEALAIRNEFKIYNHECYCAFLKEIIKDSADFVLRSNELLSLVNTQHLYNDTLKPFLSLYLVEEILAPYCL